jgi:hypothetical protein
MTGFHRLHGLRVFSMGNGPSKDSPADKGGLGICHSKRRRTPVGRKTGEKIAEPPHRTQVADAAISCIPQMLIRELRQWSADGRCSEMCF